MSEIKSNSDDLILNASGGTSTIKLQANGVERASLSAAGVFDALGVTKNGKDVGVLDSPQTYTKGQRGEVTTLTDAATIATDLNDSNNFAVTLGGNRTLSNPTNCTAGQAGSIFINQDTVGSRTLAFASYWKFVGGTAPVLSTVASSADRIDYIVRSATEIQAVVSLDVK
jgi:hypothetical protein